MDDIALLRQYTEENSEAAFAEIVARHINKVYSVALRQTSNPHQAEEITQAVFVILAKKSRSFGKGVVLSGWLYHTARLTAVTFRRSEIRRAHREQEARMQSSLNENESDAWPQISPLLDEAMTELNEVDRHAVVLRFFDGRSMNEVGAALGASEDAAKKRVHRAVEKLRLFFTRRGVAVSVGVLTTVISANAVQAAPIGLAKAVATVAITTGAVAGGSMAAFFKGLLKPLAGSSSGIFAPIVGSIFFFLKAEVETTKSPRERRFVVRMIWFRFAIALLSTAVPIAIALAMPSFVRQPGVIEFGFAGYFLFVAAEYAARTTYFHRRRHQIQIEDGTWEAFDLGKPTRPDEFLSDLMGQSSKANRYAALAAAFGLATCLFVAATWSIRMMTAGRWIPALIILVWGAFASRRWLRNWRQGPRRIFDARFGRLVKPMIFCAAMSLFLFDFSWARGRLQPSYELAVAFNILVALAYVVLIAVFARLNSPITPRTVLSDTDV